MVRGGVAMDFEQDTVVAADFLGKWGPMHKDAVLREDCSWGKVDTAFEQTGDGEAPTTLPLFVSSVFRGGAWRGHTARPHSEACR